MWNYDLAEMLKEAKENGADGLLLEIGTIINDNPLTVSLFDGEVKPWGKLLAQTKVFGDQMAEHRINGEEVIGLKVAVIGRENWLIISEVI